VLVGLAAAAAAAASFGLAAVLQGVATASNPVREVLDPRLLLELLRTRAFRAAIAGNVLGFLLHVAALQSLPLFLVQAVISSSVVVTAVVSARVLRDRLSRPHKAAIGAVCLGLVLLALAAGEGSAHPTSSELVPGLFAVLVLVGLVGAALGRVRAAWASGALGLLAGVGFALVAIGARILPELSPAALVRAPATYLVAVSGGLAFLLYANAMQRGSVTRSTAAMVVTQTAVPAAVVLALLGDRVRDGFAAVGVLGLVLAVGAVAVLVLTTHPNPLAVVAGGSDDGGDRHEEPAGL
jgi:drug/metabolite transporter (DMT)-like permease